MRFDEAIDRYIGDMEDQGRLTTVESARKYCRTLEFLAQDAAPRDPARVDRDDIKRTLRRWANPNTASCNRSILVSFFDWALEEGIREDNPARQIRTPRRRPPIRTRITEREAIRMLRAARGQRERRAIYLGLCAGLRNAEMRGLRGRHFGRPEFIWVSADIAKGHRERFVPVIPDLVPVIEEIREHVAHRQYVLPALASKESRDPFAMSLHPSSTQALRTLVTRVAHRARIRTDVTPHVLRRAFATRLARSTDAQVIQQLLGHAHISSTEIYLAPPRLEDLTAAVGHIRYGDVECP